MTGAAGKVTEMLDAHVRGDPEVIHCLLPVVYEQLRALAGSFFAHQRPDHTLQPTALVHEAFVKLADKAQPVWNDRKHFFNVAAMAMRQLLFDHARRHGAAKRGGHARRITLDQALTPLSTNELNLEALDAALTKLARLDERQARIVELRFLAGLSVEEVAELLGVSPRTVKLDWYMARAWLKQELSGEES